MAAKTSALRARLRADRTIKQSERLHARFYFDLKTWMMVRMAGGPLSPAPAWARPWEAFVPERLIVLGSLDCPLVSCARPGCQGEHQHEIGGPVEDRPR